ncbi:MAG: GNAT family N-acetyltransferase [Alphaproteobacteria bacterium]|nr:MAG: GNAT family N-acetyltransferase [Alphaproteobacteria bacterium]
MTTSPTPDLETLFRTLDATWPPAETRDLGPFRIRLGKGGGKRVSAATLQAPDCAVADIERAEREMERAGQAPLFQIRPGQDVLDKTLSARGYELLDPTLVLVGTASRVAGPGAAPVSAFRVWPPLAIMRDLWAEGGTGPARLDVMARVQCPKCAILGRSNDRAAGVAFVAILGRVAMLHALYVTKALRGAGTASNILRDAASWALDQGATHMATVTTGENLPAQNLFASLGMQVAGKYHYRGRGRNSGSSET